MLKRQSSKSFTLIELLVVVAIIALLISILLPSLQKAKQQAKKSVCLSHLRDIGTAAQEYAMEDQRNMIMPLSPIMVRDHGYWQKRCVMWYSWGGRGAHEKFLTSANGGFFVNENNRKPYYGTRQRPLTTYLYPDIEAGQGDNDNYLPSEAPVFRCPSDRGYPDLPEEVIDDAPAANAGRPMWDTVGNSYRGSLAQLGLVDPLDKFSLGVWGQRLDRLENTSRLIWGGDPLFYNLIGTDAQGQGWPEVRKYGWHGDFMMDNEVYADGHAAPTQAVPDDDPAWQPTPGDLEAWGIDPQYVNYLTRGPGWQLDAYPTPGVKFARFRVPATSSWPFRGYTTTPAPPGGWE